jgi:acetyl-CoA carboxylase alpha subunit
MDPEETCRRVGKAIGEALEEVSGLSADELRRQRYEKYRRIGVFIED